MRNSSVYYLSSFLIFSSFLAVILVSSVSGASGPPIGDVEANYTTQDVVELIAYVLLALVFSFTCSVAEAVLLNITPSFIEDLKVKQPKFAEKVYKIRVTNIDKSLAGILTMNTIAHTIGSIGSGAKATIVFGSVWFGAFSALMTLAILFLSEIIPKTVGVVFWRQLIRPVILFIRILSFTLAPFIVISEKLTQLISKGKNSSKVNRDEVVALTNLAVTEGVFNDRESRILTNLFKLGFITVKSIYTPRTVLFAMQENKTIEEISEKLPLISFSRIIIYEQDLDQVTGFVHKNDIFVKILSDSLDTPLKELKRPILAFPIFTPISEVLDKLLTEKQHIALVVDEFGTKGIVTIEDILETLLGIEIVDESDQTTDMQVLAKLIWRRRMNKLGIDKNYITEHEKTFQTVPNENPTK